MVVVLLIFLKVKIPSTAVVLLAPKKVQIWLMPCCHLKKFINGCYPAGTLKNLYMVDVLLASKKKNPDIVVVRLTFLKVKSLDMVVVILGFLSNMTHVLLSILYSIKMR